MGIALYTASSTASGGRQGSVKSSDGTLDLALSLPKGLGGMKKKEQPILNSYFQRVIQLALIVRFKW